MDDGSGGAIRRSPQLGAAPQPFPPPQGGGCANGIDFWRDAYSLSLGEFGEGVLVVGMPARQRRAVLDDVVRGPEDAALSDLAGHLVVGAEDVEVAGRQRASMKSTTWSAVQAPAGFSRRAPRSCR